MRVPRLGALRFQEAKPVLARHHVEQGATFTAEGRPVPERSEASREAKDGERTEPASGPPVGEGEGGGGEAGQDEGDGSLGEGAEQGAQHGDPDRPARATREGERPAGEHDRERGRALVAARVHSKAVASTSAAGRPAAAPYAARAVAQVASTAAVARSADGSRSASSGRSGSARSVTAALQ